MAKAPVPVRSRRLILPVENISAPVFDSSVLGVWRLNQSLDDSVGSENFVPSNGSALFKQFEKFELLPNLVESRFGLEFEEGKAYSITSPPYTFTNDFTMAFWYFSPQLVGFTRHVTTRELEPKVAPIVAKATSVKTSTETNLNSASFVVTEVGHTKTKNAIRVYLTSNLVNVSHVITSESFDSPGLHHVLITYSRARGRFRIDIDGKSGVQHSAPTTNLSSTGPLTINNIVPGFLAHKTTQAGAYIFDLVFTTIGSLDNESLKAFRYGYEHITFDSLFDTRFSYFGMSYAQPTTISTTHIFVEGGNIFAARSNGKIVQGARPVWDKEFNYPDPQRTALLTTSEVDPVPASGDPSANDRFLVWTPSGIKLRGVSIRI